MNVENWILRILRPRATRIRAIGNILVLQTGTISGVNSNERRDAMLAESARILPIDDGRSAENHDSVFFRERHRQFPPRQKIAAHCVAPRHVSPYVAKRVVLVEQVVFRTEEDQPIGIIRPVFLWTEMKSRAEILRFLRDVLLQCLRAGLAHQQH